jgi:hypothetical protein
LPGTSQKKGGKSKFGMRNVECGIEKLKNWISGFGLNSAIRNPKSAIEKEEGKI